MSENRSQEEYHDPDYSQFQSNRSPANDHKNSPDEKPNAKIKDAESRREAICRIVEREFQRELTNKEQELHEINKRLDEAKQLLAKTRYAVVHHYYNRKSLLCSEEEIAAVQKSQQESWTSYPLAGDKPQMAIHPSLKKLLGKRPINYDEILKSRPPRKAAQNATEQFQKLAKKPAETKICMSEAIVDDEKTMEIECKKPRYVAPSTSKQDIPQMNSARGRNNYRHLLVVGNVSKYIGDEEAGLATNVTHKWLIYISAKTAVPVEHIVSRARFFLHESYKPNDVVEVSGPPFQITKRGWGEFPVRVQLYFHAHLMQKPVQIFHTLVLDKKHTGLQTMGAETIVELWLNIPNTLNADDDGDEKEKASSSKVSTPEPSSSVTSSPKPIPSTSLSMSKTIENYQNPSTSKEIIVKQEPVQSNEIHEKLHQNSQNLNQNHSITPLAHIKTEQSTSVNSLNVIPQSKICDQNNANVSNPPTKSTPTVIAPVQRGNTKKTFIKCVSKDGKISLMELVQDEKNPKLFKMVLPQANQANKMTLNQSQAVNRTVNPVRLNPMDLLTSVASTNAVMQPIRPSGSFGNTTAVKVENVAQNLSNVQIRNMNPSQLIANMVSNGANSKIPNLSLNNTSLSSQNMGVPLKLPKLVAINSTLSSTSPSLQLANQIPSKLLLPNSQSTSLTSGTRIIQKNNKIVVLDSNRMVKHKQQSLLKPQVSLLKPRPSAMSGNTLKRITVSNISGIEHKNINVFVPADIKPAASTLKRSTNAGPLRQNYSDELEKRFLTRNTFTNMTEAIGWLLKQIPLISTSAKQPEFRESFPFIVPTPAEFHSLHLAKQRNFEWLRAKYLSRLVARHMILREFPKWSTKQIIIFGRWFGYTPTSVFTVPGSSIKMENNQNVRDIVKTEIMREHLKNDVISFNSKLLKWLDSVDENTSKCLNNSFDENMIVVDDEDDEKIDAKHSSPLKSRTNCLHLPIPSKFDEVIWINEVSRKMQIRFEPEEIVNGVLHRSAELVFATALRSFLEDFLRKCSGNKHRTMSPESSKTEINNDDVLRTISTIQRFDFLTNKNLGIDKKPL